MQRNMNRTTLYSEAYILPPTIVNCQYEGINGIQTRKVQIWTKGYFNRISHGVT
jgi:hypothetical protein